MDDFVGIWGCERTLGPEVRGKLTLVKEDKGWLAQIMAFEATGKADSDALIFTFPGNRGELRLRHPSGDAISGHWIQPVTLTTEYAYATPVEMTQERESVWTGEVPPFDDRISLYLVIERQQDGSLTAFVRDPQANAGIWLRITGVVVEENEVRLTSASYGEIVGRYNPQSGILSVVLPLYPVTLDFARRGRDEAPGFYPRTPALDTYTYRPPWTEADGWQTGSLEEAGFDPTSIVALVQQILDTKTTGLRSPYIQSLLIARHGRLVLEEYFYGFHRDLPHDTRSATKSLTTALVGIAMDKGKGTRFDVTTPIRDLLPKYAPFAHDDPRKSSITVEHLLTMTSGLACDDNDDDSPGNEGTMQSQQVEPDWYKFTLDLPMATEPGGEAVYCTAGINLLGSVISKGTGEWLPDFFHETFAVPLDFGLHHIQLMPSPLRDMYMGGGHYLRPRDLAKLGQLYIAGGRWNGKQVVPEEWVKRSLEPHSHFPDHDYGYGWHLGEYHVAGHTYKRAEAGGNGGEMAIIIPELDMVVSFTSGNYGTYPVWSRFRDELVPEFIIPAVHE